jgi:tetratricopeptide (TPR) repeat protein
MGFWRKDVIDFALDDETRRHMAGQMEWIQREPANPRPYFNLAQLYRMQWKPEQALGLLLEAVRLDPTCGDAHVALAEMYAVQQDYAAAWRHARAAERNGDATGVDLLTRHAVPEQA